MTAMTTTQHDQTETAESVGTAIGITAGAWLAAFIVTLWCWTEFGVERSTEFLAYAVLAGIGALGVTLTVIVGVLTRD